MDLPSLDNDADHVLAWADGGTTGITNLGQPCHKHHRLKHATAWTPSGASKNHPPGWTSPAGRHYPSEPQDWEPPHLPPDWPAPPDWESPDETDPGLPPGPNQDLLLDPLPERNHFAAWRQEVQPSAAGVQRHGFFGGSQEPSG